jgi:hypothetical protein
MNERGIDKLGPPDLTIAGFQLWVHGYEFPDALDVGDGNWLRITAHCGGSGASVWCSGALLETVSLRALARGLEDMHATLRGEAVLDSHEPNIAVRISISRTGQATVQVDVTPDHMTQKHWFEFEADQSYLPAIIAQCRNVLGRFPVRGEVDSRG